MSALSRLSVPAIPDSFTEYLNDIGRYPVLTREEETDLGRRIRAGDPEAVNALVCANLRFVVSIAKQYQRQDISLLDLIDEGNLGLIRAARKFDETRGIRFISYAVWWIRRAILQGLDNQSRIIRVPTRRRVAAQRIGRRANALFQKLGREPRPDEIAEELEISESEVASTLSIARCQLSLDAPLMGDEHTLLDYLADEANPSPENTTEQSRATAVADALATLRARDAQIVRMYFGLNAAEPMTLEEIGSRLGITRERVRQIRDRALVRLRRAMPCLALAG